MWIRNVVSVINVLPYEFCDIFAFEQCQYVRKVYRIWCISNYKKNTILQYIMVLFVNTLQETASKYDWSF